jgi:hypothetical protein
MNSTERDARRRSRQVVVMAGAVTQHSLHPEPRRISPPFFVFRDRRHARG